MTLNQAIVSQIIYPASIAQNSIESHSHNTTDIIDEQISNLIVQRDRLSRYNRVDVTALSDQMNNTHYTHEHRSQILSLAERIAQSCSIQSIIYNQILDINLQIDNLERRKIKLIKDVSEPVADQKSFSMQKQLTQSDHYDADVENSSEDDDAESSIRKQYKTVRYFKQRNLESKRHKTQRRSNENNITKVADLKPQTQSTDNGRISKRKREEKTESKISELYDVKYNYDQYTYYDAVKLLSQINSQIQYLLHVRSVVSTELETNTRDITLEQYLKLRKKMKDLTDRMEEYKKSCRIIIEYIENNKT